MTPDFYKQYRPLTSRPFLKNSIYTEYVPCQALRPYVACFWTSLPSETKAGGSLAGEKVLVIPDTCADIIIEINHTRQTVSSRLCGLQDNMFWAGQGDGIDRIEQFSIRFYFWAVRLFLNLDMKELSNENLDYELLDYRSHDAFQILLYLKSSDEKIRWVEQYLLGCLDINRLNPNLFNSIEALLSRSGNITVAELCASSRVSQRQMERLFAQQIGISMKKTASLVRYQNVWCDIVRNGRFEVHDAVYRYGFVDQSHLLNDFKRFHGMTPEQARQIALKWR